MSDASPSDKVWVEHPSLDEVKDMAVKLLDRYHDKN